MKFSIKDFFSKRDQIRSFLRIWSHLLKKSLMENFIFFVQWDFLLQVEVSFKMIKLRFQQEIFKCGVLRELVPFAQFKTCEI